MNKENLPPSPRRLSPRKSYSILAASNVDDVKLKSPSNRRYSQSTGLAKFSLSPPKKHPNNAPKTVTSKSPAKSKGLPVYVPINTSTEEAQKDSHTLQQELLSDYSTKHAQLLEYEAKVEQLKFELSEISIKLELCCRQQLLENATPRQDIFNQAHNETTKTLNMVSSQNSPLKSKPSLFFDDANFTTLKNKASSMFQDSKQMDDNFSQLKKKASTMFQDSKQPLDDNFATLKKKASNIFQINPNLNQELDELTQKTSQFFNGVMSNLSPKKATSNNILNNFSPLRTPLANRKFNYKTDKEDLINSSFNFETLDEADDSAIDNSSDEMGVIFERSVIIDIDDYTSDEE